MHKRRKIEHDFLNRQRQELVARSQLLTHPLLGQLSLPHQLGESGRRSLTPNPNEDVAASYAANLAENPIYSSDGVVAEFVVDSRDGAVLFAHTHTTGENDTLHCLRPIRPGYYRGLPHIFEAMPSSYASMSMNVQSQKLMYVSNAPWGTRTVLLDLPEDGDDPHASVLNHMWNESQDTAWQVTSSPSGASFAVATSRGLRLYNISSELISRYVLGSPIGIVGEYKAVAFGKDDRLAMAGTRSGLVVFIDLRTKDLVARVRHEDGVSALRMVDDDRLVIRGLQKVCCALHRRSFIALDWILYNKFGIIVLITTLQMSLYDLRYSKAVTKQQMKTNTGTMPYRVFPWENTILDFQMGFDVNAELGIIATGSCRSEYPASVFVQTVRALGDFRIHHLLSNSVTANQ